MESGQAMTIDDIDIYRAAKLLIDKHGDEADIIAIIGGLPRCSMTATWTAMRCGNGRCGQLSSWKVRSPDQTTWSSNDGLMREQYVTASGHLLPTHNGA